MWCKGCLSGLILGLVFSVVAATLAFLNLGRFLDVSHDLATVQRVDAILVMGGEGGRYTRTEHALELYDNGIAPLVVFSGGTLLSSGLACSSTELSLGAASDLGLSDDAVVISGEAQSTYDESINFAQLAAEHDWQSLAFVTDRFHTRRSLRSLQTTMPYATIYASAPQDERYQADRWWTTENGLVFAINEALKLGFYWRAYGIRPFE